MSWRERTEAWLTLLAAAGMAVFIGGVAHDIYMFRTAQMFPDVIHSVELVEHSHHVYVTPAQARYHLLVPFAGLGVCAASGLAAAFLTRKRAD